MSKNRRVRRRGAPAGNQNARTHGFYSQVFDEDEKRALEESSGAGGLDNEIELVRVKLRSALFRDPHNFRIVVEGANAVARLRTAGMKLSTKEKKDLTERIALTLKEERVPVANNADVR